MSSGRNIWENRSYCLVGTEPATSFYNFRISSPKIKSEFEDWFLRGHGFVFDNPVAYNEFASQLIPEQKTFIRKVSFEVMGRTTPMTGRSQRQYDNCWLEICNELPMTLEEIYLDISLDSPLSPLMDTSESLYSLYP